MGGNTSTWNNRAVVRLYLQLAEGQLAEGQLTQRLFAQIIWRVERLSWHPA